MLSGRCGLAMVIMLASSLASSHAPAQGSPSADSVTAVLRDVSRSGVLTGLRWPRFPFYRDELTALYSALEWQPMWTVGGRPNAAARDAIDALLGASERGLHPEDYDAATLDRRFGELSTGTPASARDVAWFDLALSVGVFRHVADVHIGRVNPKNLSIGINVEPKRPELARILRDGIARGRITEMVREAEPRFVHYRALKAGYSRYRALAEASPLPTVAASGVVRPGNRFDKAPALRKRLAAFGDLRADAPPVDGQHAVRRDPGRGRGPLSGAAWTRCRQRARSRDARGAERLARQASAADRARARTDPLAFQCRWTLRHRERARIPALRVRHVRHRRHTDADDERRRGQGRPGARDAALPAWHGVHCLSAVLGDPAGDSPAGDAAGDSSRPWVPGAQQHGAV